MKRNITIPIIVILVVAFGSLFYLVFWDDHCGELERYGFKYEITGGLFSTWDYVDFYFFRNPQETGRGPRIGGGPLKVRCRDIDEDGLAEYIIFHKKYKQKQTILKINPNSDTYIGAYHVYSTNGLKVAYPPEGFYADF